MLETRSQTKGGGVGIWCKPDLKPRLNKIGIFDEGTYESISIDVDGEENYTLVNFYRPPKGNITTFWAYIAQQKKEIDKSGRQGVFVGDSNLNLLHQNNVTLNSLQQLDDLQLEQIVEKPTRVTKNSKTLIDHVYISPGIPAKAEPQYTGISDHEGIFLHILDKIKLIEHKYELYNNFCPKNLESLAKALSEIYWPSFFAGLNANKSAYKFETEIKLQISRHCPKEAAGRKRIKLSSKTLKLKAKLKRLRKLVKNDSSYGEEYFTLKADYEKSLKQEIKEYNTKNLRQRNPKLLWNNIKEIADLTRPNTNSNFIKADTFAKYFKNIPVETAQQIPKSSRNPLNHAKKTSETLKLEKVTQNDVYKILSTSIPKRSTGHDGLSSWLSKKLRCFIKEPLTIIINKIIDECKFPETWKLAKIVPLHKKGDKAKVENYRPISLLPAFSKIAEKVIHKQLYDYMEINNLFPENQFGFRRGKSTAQALNTIIYETEKLKSNKSNYAIILMDFSKAFDLINHKILFGKMQKLGMDKSVITLLDSYLRDRKMYVQVGESNSNITTCHNIGCPQGSVLGPLLYLIYTTCIPQLFKNINHTLFADDTAVITKCDKEGKDITNLLCKSQKHFNSIKLKLNMKKTEILMNTTKKVQIQVNNDQITTKTRCESSKYLGIQLNADLNWNDHVKQTSNKMRKGLYALHKLKTSHLSPEITYAKLNVFEALVMSHANYCNGSWNALLNKKQTTQLGKLQKAAIRSVYNKHFLHHTHELFCLAKKLPINLNLEKGVISQYSNITGPPWSKYGKINSGKTRQRGYVMPKVKGKTLAKQADIINKHLSVVNSNFSKKTKMKLLHNSLLDEMKSKYISQHCR